MSPAPTPGERLPDVYWVILDRYGSGNVIDKYFDYDNSPFLDELRSRGFYIAEHATANYVKTALSLDSSRNLEYLDFDKLRDGATSDRDWGPLYRKLKAPFEVEHYLGSAGYRFIYLGTYWGPTSNHPSAEISYVYSGLSSEFLDVLTSWTPLSAIQDLVPDSPFDWRLNRWNQSRYEWDSLNRASSLGGPIESLQLTSVGGRPVYRLRGGGRSLAIYADDTMVGFVMYGREAETGFDWIIRLMIDVRYQDFRHDLLGTVATIYERLGLELTADTRARQQAFLDAHPGDAANSLRRYTFAQTGLDEGELRERVRPYQEHFAIESEQLS